MSLDSSAGIGQVSARQSPPLAEPVNAVVWTGRDGFEMIATGIPQLQEGETLIRLQMATICGSDRHTVSGRRKQPCPSVLGHEGVGLVVDTRNPDLVLGQRVTFAVTAACLKCDRCRAGRTAKCRELRKTGHEAFKGSWPLSGTYATHIVLRAGQTVVNVPELMGDIAASISSCAGATVMAAVEAAQISSGNLSGKKVLIVGLGMLGLIAVEVVSSMGADVTAVDPLTQRLAWARDVGAGQTYAHSELPGDVEESYDIALEFSGAESGVKTCIQSLDIGGTAVLAGSVASGPVVPIDPEWVVRGWRSITGVHNYEPRHLHAAVEFLARSSIDWATITDGPIGLADVADAFSTPPSGALRTVVDCSRVSRF